MFTSKPLAEGGREGAGGGGGAVRGVSGGGGRTAGARRGADDGVGGRGLHSFPFQLNLSSFDHRITQLNSRMCLGVAQVEL